MIQNRPSSFSPSASQSLLQRHSKHRSPRGRSFYSCKRNQNTVKGESVPLDRVLPTFARTKVGTRRAGVQIKTFYKTMRRRQATTNQPHRSGIPFMPHQRLPQPLGRGSPFLSLIYTARALHRWCAGYGAPGGCPARPNTPRTAPSPRGSRGSCAGSWPHLRYTGPPRARNADR